MIQNRRPEIKQTALALHGRNNSGGRIFSHRKTPSHSLLQKKPQLLLMKWNDFLEKYHLYKQLHTINNSINSANTHLKMKKQELTIIDVPYIQSEQASISQRENQEQQIFESKITKAETKQNVEGSGISNIKATTKTKSSAKTIKIGHLQSSFDQNSNKMIISVQLSEGEDEDKEQKEENQSENFTDEEDENATDDEQLNKSNVTKRLTFTKGSTKQKQATSNDEVQESLRKTAHFSFSNTYSKSKSPQPYQHTRNNQQNINHLNCQLKSKKVQVLLKLKNEQEIRRIKAQKIMKEDREYLSKFLNKK